MPCIETMADYLAAMRKVIETDGWMVHTLAAEDDRPLRSHSLGLTARHHPEIVVCGFDPRVMTQLINRVGETVQTGRRIADWSVIRGIVTQHPVVFRELQDDAARRATKVIGRLFPHFQLLQMFLPDSEGQFPWQDRCHPGYKRQLCFDYVSTSESVAIL